MPLIISWIKSSSIALALVLILNLDDFFINEISAVAEEVVKSKVIKTTSVVTKYLIL
jgi:hypothetical protein